MLNCYTNLWTLIFKTFFLLNHVLFLPMDPIWASHLLTQEAWNLIKICISTGGWNLLDDERLRGCKGINISEQKLKKIMPSISPLSHSSRQSNSHERSNPAIYSARYFGHKLHMDQNKKSIHYGVTYVMVRGMGIRVKWLELQSCHERTMKLYMQTCIRAAKAEFGLWNQLRVDHGKEFFSISWEAVHWPTPSICSHM